MKKTLIWMLMIILSLALVACSNTTNTQTKAQKKGIVAGKVESNLKIDKINPNGINFTYGLKNQTEKVQKFSFTNGQRYEYVITSNGVKVRKFSDGAAFVQTTYVMQLKQGQEMNYKLFVNGLTKGKYNLEVWLTSTSNNKYLQTTDFEIK